MQPGSLAGPYEILSPLGEGTANVYRARDRRVGRVVAVKFLPARLHAERQLAMQLERDARALASLNHRNIVAIHEFDVDADPPFVASELIEGATLRARMAAGIPWKKALEIAAGIADGLAMAHARGLTHRDLTPENVMIAADGTPKILDFATACLKANTPPDDERAGSPRAPAYAAPEEVRGEEPSPASDLFSLGVILYEMIAGRNPFARETPDGTFAAIQNDEPPSLRSPMSEIPAELDLLVHQCLEKASDERCGSARELAVELRAIQRDAEHPHEVLARRRRRIGATAAVAAMVLGGFLFFSRARVADLLGVAGDPPASMVVLPFANGAGADTEYLSDGLTGAFIGQLSQVRALRVIAPGTSLGLKGSPREPVDIGRDLAVEAVVSGRLDVEGDRLVLTVNAVDAVTRAALYAEKIELPRARIAELPGIAARELANDLRLPMGHAERVRVARAPTPSKDAFEPYLRALGELARETSGGRERAIAHLERAVRADPGFALAHAALGEAYLHRAAISDPEEGKAKARSAISRALAIDPSLAEGHQALGLLRYLDEWDLAAAEAEFRRALELNPNLAATYGYRSSLLLYRGWFDAAIEQARRARELDPLSRTSGIVLADALLASDRVSEAHDAAARLVRAAPDYPPAHERMGRVLERRGEGGAACGEFVLGRELAGGDSAALARLRAACARGGLEAYRRELLLVLRESETGARAFEIATTYAALGETENAYRYLEIAYETRSNGILTVGIEPAFAPLRGDPRVASLLRRAGVGDTIALETAAPLRASALSGGGPDSAPAPREN